MTRNTNAKLTGWYRYEPVGIDAWEGKWADYAGQVVRKTQPFGTPRNGTMGHCFIATPEGEFIGLVLCNSLVKLTKKEAMAA